MVKEVEFYELLSISATADETEIKRAYRKLALKYHPDKNPDDANAAEMFKKIGEAYETLSDPEKRKLYDTYGKSGLDNAAGGSGGFHDPSDLFSMFFGGGGGKFNNQQQPKPRDLVHELPVTLEEIYTGATKKVMVSRTRMCAACSGNGVKEGCKKMRCTSCNGHGVQVGVQQIFPGFHQQVQIQCSSCRGEGEITRPEDTCQECNGRQTKKEKKILEVVIEKGAKNQDVISFTGEGNQVPGMTLSGDILIFLAQQPHDTFRRVGNHLFINKTISLFEALCGLSLSITHLDGRHITLCNSEGAITSPNAAWCVHREGMPLPNTGGVERGNLYLHVEVEFPVITSSEKKSVKPSKKTSSVSPLGLNISLEQLNKLAAIWGLPAKLPLLNGQRVELKDFIESDPLRTANILRQQMKKKSTTGRRGNKGGRKGNKRNQRSTDGFPGLFEDTDDDDGYETEETYTTFSSGPQQRGSTQTVECAHQ